METDERDVLNDLAAATNAEGEDLLPALVTHLARHLGAEHALVAEAIGEGRARSLAFLGPNGLEESFEWDLAGSIASSLKAGELASYPAGARREFARDALLARLEIESYFGTALSAPDGRVFGHLAVFDRKPLTLEPRKRAVLRIVGARASAELARRSTERTLRESEQRLLDLFDEAPIAYVHEGVDTKFIRANRTALRTLGIRPEDVPHTYGRTFVPETPEAQRRLREAFESVGRGADTSGVVLELRRKDNGKPLWIQWWSRPDPSGTYTRTMFVDITERVLLEREQARLKEQNRYLREEIKSVHNFEEIIGRSTALLSVLENVKRVAKTDASVLISGETGTGKELVARAIHSSSARHDKPLIKINCAALPAGLIESELFGHEKGAFSGAIARRIGRFELAHGGTIFLDEIGELPPDMQVKLLRVLQEREFERLGGNTPMQVDVRVIAATNRDLPRAIAEGKFREDLYYRLNVFPIHMPPLRDRGDDVPLLAQYFLDKFAARVGKRLEGATPGLVARLKAYRWPGNVRELQNIVERAVILAPGDVLDVDSAPLLAAEPDRSSVAPARTTSLEAVEREHIRATLERSDWVIEGPSGAAKALAMHPNTLRSRMKKLGIARGSSGAARALASRRSTTESA